MTNTNLTTLDENELVRVLQNSLYPGSKKESVLMVLGYCKANGLDPMQKPVHIVPMYDKNAKAYRDVVMPGVNLYRTNAARSGQLVSISDVEFGPMVKTKFGAHEFEHPEYATCRVVRNINGRDVEFCSREFFIEIYTPAGKDNPHPNSMWTRRPRGMLAKCVEASALRKAFPEQNGTETAEEMEGRAINEDFVEGEYQEKPTRPARKSVKSESPAPSKPVAITNESNKPNPLDPILNVYKTNAPEKAPVETVQEQEAPAFELQAEAPISDELAGKIADVEAQIETIDNLDELYALYRSLPTNVQVHVKDFFAKRKEELEA